MDAIKLAKVELHQLYVDLFYKYDDSNLNEFIVICEHHNEQLPFNWVSHNFDVNPYLLPYLAFNITSHNYGFWIIAEVLMVLMFM
jgi:hypothetical protein